MYNKRTVRKMISRMAAVLLAAAAVMTSGTPVMAASKKTSTDVSASAGTEVAAENGEGSGEDAELGEAVMVEEPEEADTGETQKEEPADTGNTGAAEDSGSGDTSPAEEVPVISEEKEAEEKAEIEKAEKAEKEAEAEKKVAEEKAKKEAEEKKKKEEEEERKKKELMENHAIEEEKEDDEELQKANNSVGTNEELIARQQIERNLPKIVFDFRFYIVDGEYAVSAKAADFKEEADDGSRTVGTIGKYGSLYILKEVDDTWVYAESGDVRGFVRSADLIKGEEAKDTVAKERAAYMRNLLFDKAVMKKDMDPIPGMIAKAEVPVEDNAAATYTKTTARGLAKKVYAVAKDNASIREGRDDSAREVGKISKGGMMYVLTEEKDGWDFVESGDVRGFIRTDSIKTGDSAERKVKGTGESGMPVAEKSIEPEENKVLFHTILSVKEGTKNSEKREKILELAQSCVGNPYVWGGTDPFGSGADCSGFAQTIYKCIGINIPRVACDQAQFGTKIPVEDAAPGDLVFFAKNGYVHHVAIFKGKNQTIEALGRKYGIVNSHLDGRNTVWACRILDD